jgi:large subunit ribosomal protein L1
MSKRYNQALEQVDLEKKYEIKDALELAQKTATANFDETIEVSVRLGIDSGQNDQQVRDTVVLPEGTGNEVKVVAFAQGEKEKEAEQAGADVIGGEELAEKIEEGWMDFDAVVATPDMMQVVGKLGPILGPRGLMPNPKTGTVTFDLEKAIGDLKAGKIEYRADKGGNVNVPLGKASFDLEELYNNFETFTDALIRSRPSGVKGRYMLNLAVSATMGPGIKIDRDEVLQLFK